MKERLYNIDLLKVVAAMLIVFHHYQQLSSAWFQGINFYGGHFTYGYLVELFFIISGFFAAMSSNYKAGIRRPIIKRILRLLPMAFISVMFNLIILFLYRVIIGHYMFDTNFSAIQIITSLLLLNQGWIVEYFPAINNPIWYLCVLMWLSFLYVIITVVAKGNKKTEVLISISLVLLGIVGWKFQRIIGNDLPFLHTSDFRGYTTFFIGVCLYHIYNSVSKFVQVVISCILLLFAVVCMFVLGFSNWYVLVILLFPGIVLLAASVPQISNSNISFLGNVSYEVYLWHMPIYCLAKFVIDLKHVEINHSYFTMIMFTIMVWFVSICIYQYVERIVNKKIGKIQL